VCSIPSSIIAPLLLNEVQQIRSIKQSNKVDKKDFAFDEKDIIVENIYEVEIK
jgi:hypothetical protein